MCNRSLLFYLACFDFISCSLFRSTSFQCIRDLVVRQSPIYALLTSCIVPLGSRFFGALSLMDNAQYFLEVIVRFFLCRLTIKCIHSTFLCERYPEFGYRSPQVNTMTIGE
ncbi:hypothetical protein CSKR_201636 [Clonorchis sinensis]|uniref:Uncharacterized protein n=1 Tax=Clonorchis sinensis TaxID=79923 RepID=A0A8T1MSD5_CLOSI|nr:hypothetical protein CSKR_201636 [Clonorchis sinensis]